MKTLKEWFDGLSESAQSWVIENCSAWFDKDQADYYKKPLIKADSKDLMLNILGDLESPDKYSSYANDRVINRKYIALLRYLNYAYPKLISTELMDKCIYEVIDYGNWNSDTWLNLSDKTKEKAFIRCYKKWNKMSLDKALYLIKDYSNINLNWDEVEIPTALTPEIIEIIGKETAIELIYKQGYRCMHHLIKPDSPHEVFDELFFCQDSKLTQQQKLEILRLTYANNNYKSTLPDEKLTRDFFKRIVAVDHAYLRYIYNIIASYPGLAMKLYNEKKPESELTGNESTTEQYRYPKEIRKLFVIAHMCALKRVSKVKSSIAKEVAPLLKIYGYKWDDVYDALYPNDPRLV